jgi:hypothetical protein
MRHCFGIAVAPLMMFMLLSPASAASGDTGAPAQDAASPQKAYLNQLELAMHALAATCIRYPNGIGLPGAVAPGQPFSLPPLAKGITRKFASGQGVRGWRLPDALGQAVLLLRPDGSCSILIRKITPDQSGQTVRSLFDRLENLRLKRLEKRTCIYGGLPTTTETYSMIPADAGVFWQRPEIQQDESGTARTIIWRGFLLAIAARANNDGDYSMVMTTYVGRHVLGGDCPPEQKL